MNVKFYHTHFVCACLLAYNAATAQLTVAPNQTAAVLASAITGTGVTVSSPTLTCVGVSNATFRLINIGHGLPANCLHRNLRKPLIQLGGGI